MKKVLISFLAALTCSLLFICCQYSNPEPETIPQEQKFSVQFIISASTIDTEPSKEQITDISKGSTLTASDLVCPAIKGHSFDGWFTDSSFSTPFTTETPIDSDLTLYAKCTPEKYMIIYINSVGVDFPDDFPIYHTYGTDTTLASLPSDAYYALENSEQQITKLGKYDYTDDITLEVRLPRVCTENDTRCSEIGEPQVCTNGQWVDSAPCGANQYCTAGKCESTISCADDEKLIGDTCYKKCANNGDIRNVSDTEFEYCLDHIWISVVCANGEHAKNGVCTSD